MSEKKNEQNDDFLDFSTIKEEINDGPNEEEFTRAMDQMSKTDRDIFEDTGIIHIDRDMPAETQAMHVISLQKQNEKRKRKIVSIIVCFMLAGVVVAFGGIYLKSHQKQLKAVKDTSNQQPAKDAIALDETTFPDALFRTYIQKNFDKDGNGELSGEELSSVIAIIAPEDSSLTSLQGIEYFTELQTLTFSNTGVTSIDLTNNTKLTFISCENTPVADLILPADSPLQCQVNEDGTVTSCK